MSNETEVFELATGYSVIDVRGGEFDLALFVGGRPIALNWSDCEGSVAQYLRVRVGRIAKTNFRRSGTLSKVIGFPNVPISSQLYPFLNCLVLRTLPTASH